MSKGLGRIQQRILTAFLDSPEGSFGVEELASIAYPGEEIGHRHRVAVLRAADRVCAQSGWEKTKQHRVVRYYSPATLAKKKVIRLEAFAQLKNL